MIITQNTPKVKGFGGPPKDHHYFAVELNLEDIPMLNGEPDINNAEPIELLELHHISFSPVQSKKEKRCLAVWTSGLMDDPNDRISSYKLLAEFYVYRLNKRAIELGANIARIYANSHLGDNRIRANSVGHYYDSLCNTPLIDQAVAILKNHLFVHAIVPGDKVSLKNRLGT